MKSLFFDTDARADDARRWLIASLARHGFQVWTASEIDEAWPHLDAEIAEVPRLWIVRCARADDDVAALALCRRVREKAATRAIDGVRVLAVVPPDAAALVTSLIVAGADDVLFLPSSPAEIDARVDLARAQVDVAVRADRPAAADASGPQLADALATGVAVVSRGGSLLYVNPAFGALLGRRSEALLGTAMTALVTAPCSARWQQLDARVYAVGQGDEELQLRHADGSAIDVYYSARRLDAAADATLTRSTGSDWGSVA
ncbi:MAG: PAS domain-containing protein, partial [Acidobacteriota bacterium]